MAVRLQTRTGALVEPIRQKVPWFPSRTESIPKLTDHQVLSPIARGKACHTSAIELTLLRHPQRPKFRHPRMEFASEFNMQSTSQLEKCVAHTNGASIHDLDNQRLRILRCTAHAMASSPGGLFFNPGACPWLEGLPLRLSRSSRRHAQPRRSGMQLSAN